MRRPRTGPLLVALAACIMFAALGSALAVGSAGGWYAGLDKPRSLVPLTALAVALYRYERVSAVILSPYYAWVLYDLAWTYELRRLNGGF